MKHVAFPFRLVPATEKLASLQNPGSLSLLLPS